MFVDFKCSTLNIQVRDYLNPMENSVPRFSVSCFHSVKSGLTKHFFASVNGVLVRLSTVKYGSVQSSPVQSIPEYTLLNLYVNVPYSCTLPKGSNRLRKWNSYTTILLLYEIKLYHLKNLKQIFKLPRVDLFCLDRCWKREITGNVCKHLEKKIN